MARQNTDAGLALKAVAALALFVRPLLSAVCAPLCGRAPLYRGGSGLVARHPADAEKKIRDVANCNFRHAAISPLRSNLDV